MQTLEQFIDQFHPEIKEQYFRKTTPGYYHAGGRYNPTRSGFGCIGPSDKVFVLKNKADYVLGDNGNLADIQLSLYDENKPEDTYSCFLSEAFNSFKLVDSEARGTLPKNNKSLRYIETKEGIIKVILLLHRDWKSKRLGVICHVYMPSGVTYDYYSRIGDGICNLQTNFDPKNSRNYSFKKNVSVRQFKQIVFGDPNFKIKCSFFENM